MASFAPGGSGAVSLNVSGTGLVKTQPGVLNIPILLANTEYAINLPANTVSFLVSTRRASRLQLSYIAGQSAAIYLTIHPGSCYSESDLVPQSRQLFFQSTTAGDTVEVLYWAG